ncbi:tetratricopeptide repeat protein [Parabacteroides sp. FAFU027]|uniref:tetratricopeptide repeat protein n=1 Tax=Parabacteroides sp. FAFU027 TaxID=2922715 RepID=UPI001FAF1E46|nr:tetratricopeptide repeat protein [Parabacteroides sp. FAFU027]
MSILNKIKGLITKREEIPNSTTQENTEKKITVYDKDGNQYAITQKYWIDNVLPTEFEKVWNKPDDLYSLIVMCLQDEVYDSTILPAQHLFEIDFDKQRAILILGLVYLKNNKLELSEKTFKEAIELFPNDGYLQTNLAKVYAEKGDEKLSYDTLWKALLTDPNQENAIIWIAAIHYEKGGNTDRLKILDSLSMIPGSWRPQLWIARDLLENGKFEEAKTMYKSVLSVASKYSDAMLMISGDLGKNNRVEEVFELVFPLFNIKQHGINTALNLVQSSIISGRKEVGLEILADIKQEQRLDYAELVNRFEKQLNEI